MDNNILKEEISFLVQRAKNKDTDAFAKLYEIIYKDLYRMALYTLGNSQDAENAVSDAVVDAFLGIEKLQDPKAFRTWMFRILTAKCARQISENVKSRNLIGDITVERVTETLISSNDEIGQVLDRSIVEMAFLALNDEEKQIVTMTVYGQMDSGEIAECLNMNRNTVRSIYHRALAKMKKKLEAGGISYGR
ncbi:MAG: RNA polymerase sigma factor [Eubacterium sp.]|nr:RNA polymerase sigma factor [Eubacterium sp.]